MKVVQINSVCGRGSTGKIVVDISKKLNKQKIENYIFYGHGDSDYPNAVKFGSNLNVNLHKLQTRLLGKHGFYSYFVTRAMIKKLSAINPDVIHLHNLHGHYLHVGLLFKYLSKSNKKVLWTLHDCWSFTGHCAHFDYIGCLKWKNLCSRCPQLKQYPKSLVFDRSKGSYVHKKKIFTSIKDLTIITPSSWLANLVKESYLKQFPVKVIHNGIDLDTFKPADTKSLDENLLDRFYDTRGKFIILSVAIDLNERKGGEYLKKFASLLEEDELLVIVGVTEKQKKELPNNVIGIEKTNSVKELSTIYSRADIFINTTLEDTFPTVNLEALACGTPVVTFNTGGSPETIDDKTGIVIEQGNLNELKKAVKFLKENSKSSYEKNCIDRAKTRFNKDSNFEEYLKLY